MASKTRAPTVEPENEPEYVGAHSGTTCLLCSHAVGESIEDLESCGNEATHTVVERAPDGTLHEIPSCDECGEPDDFNSRFQEQ